MKENSVSVYLRFVILASLAVSSLPVPVAAQVPAPANVKDQPVDQGIEQLVEMAMSANADLQATRQRVSEAKGLLRQSTFKINPSLDTSYGSGGAFGSTSLSELSVGYNQTFELGGKRARRIEVSEWGVKLAEFEIAERERQLRAEVKSRYGETLAAMRNLQVTDRQLELTRESFRITSARVQQGEAPTVDQGLLQVEVGRLESDRTLVENLVARTLLSIKPLTGLALDQPLTLQGNLSKLPKVFTLAEVLAKGLSLRPDLAAIRIGQSLRGSETRAAKAEAIPNVIGTLRYTRSDDTLDQLGLSRAGAPIPIRDLDHMVSAGLSVTLPIRNRNQGNIQAAIARTESARLRSQYLERIVAQEITSAFGRFEAAGRSLAIFDQSILARAEQNVGIIRAAYTAGELRLFDVLNEQRRLIDTQRAYTEVLREYFLSVVELERAIGSPIF